MTRSSRWSRKVGRGKDNEPVMRHLLALYYLSTGLDEIQSTIKSTHGHVMLIVICILPLERDLGKKSVKNIYITVFSDNSRIQR